MRPAVVTLALSVAAALSIAACSAVLPATYSESDLPDLGALTIEWGCGHGFWASNPPQTVALRFAYQGEGGAPTPEIDLPHPEWEATLVEGTDLFANWCDDVIETDEPVPVEHWNLTVVAGHLSIEGDPGEQFSGGSMSVSATGLKVELVDGTVVDLGDIDISNPMWGFFAG
ncbi:hypothetical protein BH23ACT5_BH23ACT5_03600 [soil metagenome]